MSRFAFLQREKATVFEPLQDPAYFGGVTIRYLQGKPWSEWTREERFFCSVLYHRAAPRPKRFAKWVIQTAKLELSSAGEWDLGYEVCLYRDVLWRLGKKGAKPGTFCKEPQ